MTRRILLLSALAGLLWQAPLGMGSPSLSDAALLPTAWSTTTTAVAAWTQNEFTPPLAGPASVEINLADDGSTTGAWEARASTSGPLSSGPNGVLSMPVGDLSGRHRVRVVVAGTTNSPMELGTLQLDRTPPAPSLVDVATDRGTAVARWSQADALSGTDPAAPLVAEINASPRGDAAGEWIPFSEQPLPGDGRRVARTSLGALGEGSHLVRVRSRDRAGNAGDTIFGTVFVDRTAPQVSGARLARGLTSPTTLAEILYEVTDEGGVGIAGEKPRVGPVGSGDEVDWAVPGAPGAGHVMVQLPGPGVYTVTVRQTDRAGNRGESAPVTIRVPTAAEAADITVGPAPASGAGTGASPGSGVVWAYGQAQTTLPVGVARDAASWRRLLGVTSAARFAGYSTLGGRILLGPAATRGLETAGRLRVARSGHGALRASRADIDEAVLGLAVLLHESLHETGPIARSDALGTRSGRALEEGLTEAATTDLLPRFVASLDVPARVRVRLAAGVRRYRPAYGPELAWVRGVSATATGSRAGSARARGWRIRAADSWGADRWSRLAVATSRDEASLRAEVAGLGGSGPLR